MNTINHSPIWRVMLTYADGDTKLTIKDYRTAEWCVLGKELIGYLSKIKGVLVISNNKKQIVSIYSNNKQDFFLETTIDDIVKLVVDFFKDPLNKLNVIAKTRTELNILKLIINYNKKSVM